MTIQTLASFAEKNPSARGLRLSYPVLGGEHKDMPQISWTNCRNFQRGLSPKSLMVGEVKVPKFPEIHCRDGCIDRWFKKKQFEQRSTCFREFSSRTYQSRSNLLHVPSTWHDDVHCWAVPESFHPISHGCSLLFIYNII